ncbi:vicilin-like seed storage protein At2g28490 [Macadamia integrifolia]|uniref:vicilin-like seed storage protein At2g28490 n=1 Tax=Macadamia integrifolia TaxID=60698 RepID=UPI001C5305D1|nr:vicilin-like seed storage protein At2g28490 [Macadamia integrifolia]
MLRVSSHYHFTPTFFFLNTQSQCLSLSTPPEAFYFGNRTQKAKRKIERERENIMATIKCRDILSLFLFVIFFFSLPMAMGYYDEEGEGEGEGEGREWDRGGQGRREERGDRRDMFLLHRSQRIVSTEAGEMTVVRGLTMKGMENPIHIGFINMEPKTLFIPQYIDSNLVLFVRRGEVKIGWIHKDSLVDKQLNTGDLYTIPAGSSFYMLNTGEGQRLQIICSIDTSESIGRGPFQSFFIGGGRDPQPVLAGFDPKILCAAMNITESELDDFLTRQTQGPILYVPDAQTPGNWASFMQLKQRERLEAMEIDEDDEKVTQEKREEEQGTWSWRKLLGSVIGKQQNKEKEGKSTVGSHHPYNIYDKSPDFQNSYGWSLAVDKHDYHPLKHFNIGVYLVNLTAGSMMAPHVNPTATEYGIVLSGEGSIQVVFPNGSSAMNAKVREGDIFVAPRYFPFCQIASREGPMEFFGFTTSAKRNHPQFLVGANSILQTMRGPELATAFGLSEKRFNKLVDSQHESVIIPTVPAMQPEEEEQQPKEEEQQKQQEEEEEVQQEEEEKKGYHDVVKGRLGSFMRSIENEMVMGFY